MERPGYRRDEYVFPDMEVRDRILEDALEEYRDETDSTLFDELLGFEVNPTLVWCEAGSPVTWGKEPYQVGFAGRQTPQLSVNTTNEEAVEILEGYIEQYGLEIKHSKASLADQQTKAET